MIEFLSPPRGRPVASPLTIARIRYRGASARVATLTVGEVQHVIELPSGDGEIRENITLLEGLNRLVVRIGDAEATTEVMLPPSSGGVSIVKPEGRIATRAAEVAGRYKGVSCPAGVIAVNGFMQQFATRGADGGIEEKIVLRPGANHLAIQIGEHYATRVLAGDFAPAKLLVTLVWDTPTTDVDLYVAEPGGGHVFFSAKTGQGTLDVDRTQGFGPENYSLAPASAREGDYLVRVHYYADRGLGRSEWTVRVITDESSKRQVRRSFYGILDHSRAVGAPTGTGRDWNDVCRVRIGKDGTISIIAEA